jgi:hypothetical protein
MAKMVLTKVVKYAILSLIGSIRPLAVYCHQTLILADGCLFL